MCFDSIKIFIYIDEVILIIIMADEKLVPKLKFFFNLMKTFCTITLQMLSKCI